MSGPRTCRGGLPRGRSSGGGLPRCLARQPAVQAAASWAAASVACLVQQPPSPRPVGEVLRPAVSQSKPHPLAGDPKMALCRTGGECGWNSVGFEFGPRGEIAVERAAARGIRDVASCVLQQRHEVVGRMANGGALEVDDRRVRWSGQSEQVASEEIPMHEAGRAGRDRCQHSRQRRSRLRSRAAGGAGAPNRAGHHQSNSVPKAVDAIAAASHDGKPAGGAARCMTTSASTAASSNRSAGSPRSSRTDSKSSPRSSSSTRPHASSAASIVGIRQADAAQMGGDAEKRADILRRRGVHQHGGTVASDPQVTPEAGILCQRFQVVGREAVAREEQRDQVVTVHAGPSRFAGPVRFFRRVMVGEGTRSYPVLPSGQCRLARVAIAHPQRDRQRVAGRRGRAGRAIQPARSRRARPPSPVPSAHRAHPDATDRSGIPGQFLCHRFAPG